MDRDLFNRIPDEIRRILGIVALIIILSLILEIGLNFWVRSALRRSLVADNEQNYQIDSKVGWLGLKDVFKGRVNVLKVNARDCRVNDLQYSKLVIDSQGFRYDPAVLVREKRLKILEMKRTRITVVIDERALTDYLILRYPEYQSSLKIKADRLILSGTAHILNQTIPVKLEGDLKATAPKLLRFYPARLLIANRDLSGPLLQLASEQIPLEFGIMEGWPLKITDFKLKEKQIEIVLEEPRT